VLWHRQYEDWRIGSAPGFLISIGWAPVANRQAVANGDFCVGCLAEPHLLRTGETGEPRPPPTHCASASRWKPESSWRRSRFSFEISRRTISNQPAASTSPKPTSQQPSALSTQLKLQRNASAETPASDRSVSRTNPPCRTSLSCQSASSHTCCSTWSAKVLLTSGDFSTPAVISQPACKSQTPDLDACRTI